MRLIDADALDELLKDCIERYRSFKEEPIAIIRTDEINTIRNLVKEQMPTNGYTAHEVACIIADLFGDTHACNFNDIDEWLPMYCEFESICPDTEGVACWEMYLKALKEREKENETD